MQMRKCMMKLSRCCCACLTRFIQTTDDTRDSKAYQTLVRLFDGDNMTILKHLIYTKNDVQPLVDGTTRLRVSLEVLRKKTVLLLISDLDIAIEDIDFLNYIYKEYHARPENQFEMVWLPIVDIDPKSAASDMTHQQKFEELQSIMPWYTVHHPSILEPAVIRYIREEWRFSKSIIIVALDPQGRLASPNALHMIRIWGNLAFPFTKEREEALWREESWTLKLIIDGLDDGTMEEWVRRGSYICLFGGEDLEWIRKLTATAKEVAKIAGIMLGMVYVGKSKSKEGVQRTAATITSEKLSYCWNDPRFFWLFWARLESMLHSKVHLGNSIENDPLLSWIQTILNFDRSDEGWAVFCQGVGPDMVAAEGNIVLENIEEFDKWKDDANQKGFVNALRDHLIQKHLIRLFDEIHLDNLTMLKHLIYAEEDIQPLVDGTTKSRVGLEVLTKKTVLLLISDLDISFEDMVLLDHIYRESRARPENQFEIVWLPIVDIDPKSAAWDMTHQQIFETLQSIMPWYTVHHPSILEPAVIKYIREEWRFSKSIIIVALDPQGRLASPNAFHMIRIWGNLAFPFAKEREEALWREERWTLKLIIGGLDDGTIKEWVTQGSSICLFGSEDLEWIRKFTATAKQAAKTDGITLEMVYVGKSDSKERVQSIAAMITSEKLSYCWNDPTFFWLFWARLESILHSKAHHGITRNDPVIDEIRKIRTYDRTAQGWAILCQGAGMEMGTARSDIALLDGMGVFHAPI
ncbi:hypothetical protein ACJRO7_009313 [Eucalyptus globulus]|uniref:Sieve element occlusion C-terminal domain-containing protein n=1 Tax=Eucalyptus globulus TaxID=34317 RepID=A0ABD3L8C5_EUCGL